MAMTWPTWNPSSRWGSHLLSQSDVRVVINPHEFTLGVPDRDQQMKKFVETEG